MENYSLFSPGPKVTHYGESTFDLTEPSDEVARTEMCRAKIKSEIDGRMRILEVKSHYLHKLLELYYLRDFRTEQMGACHIPDGWVIVARLLGLPAGKNKWDRALFDRVVAEAVRVLFHLRADSVQEYALGGLESPTRVESG